MNGERAYTTKEISDHLEIGTSTLRKWCLALEEKGYIFARTEGNKRLFIERDLLALKYFQKLVQGENFSLENASKVIVSRYEKEASESGTPSVPSTVNDEKRSLERSDELISFLMETVEKQEKFNMELLDRLDRQQTYIEERLNKRDELLMQSMRESQETKKLILAAQEERKQRKGIMKWFSKN